MTSSGDRRLEDPGSSLMVGVRFFKIILQSTLRDKKLLIPGKIVGKCGDCLPKSAVLEVPSGDTWTVDVVSDEIGVWFGNGWQEFAEFYSLQFGHFLVFEYEGCSRFSVVICDRTAAEIAYPIRNACESYVGEIEVSQHLVKNKKMRGSISAGNAARLGSLPRRIVSQADGLSKFDDEQEGESKRMISDKPSCSRKRRAITGFSPPHPFFQVQITTSMLTKKQLHVPARFSTRYISQDEKVVELQVRDECTWSVTVIRKRNCKYVRFAGGWHRFAEDNSVKPGDVCVFECIRTWPNVLLKVTIVRECV